MMFHELFSGVICSILEKPISASCSRLSLMAFPFVSYPISGARVLINAKLFCINLLPVAMASSPVQGLADGMKSSFVAT